ncbi:MAG TPA: triose-phosphate isomerase [Fimbriimonadaceae bacterium]|nr:triose-phosphate isomerase [Fimbriimonadaceae bacterium]
MRRKLVVGNWKMNKTVAEADDWCWNYVEHQLIGSETEVGVAPPYLGLVAVAESLYGTDVMVGGQDAFWLESGAYTGLVSPTMLKDAGGSFCILGHSERRGRFGKLEVPEETLPYFSETDATLNLKLAAVLKAGLTPILCCGETQAERDSGMTDSVIERQLRGALHGFTSKELQPLVLAYEPVWAIGTGKVCDSGEASRISGFIRSHLKVAVSTKVSRSTRILYGGSVKSSNAAELFAMPDIDGGLVGGASLDPAEFAKIVGAA